MNVSSYLADITKKSKRDGCAVTLFYGASYQLLFFAQLFDYLKKNYSETITCEDFSSLGKSGQFNKLRMSFLGNTTHYWFKNISSVDKKTQKLWAQFISSYTGPHNLSFFVETKVFESIYKNVLAKDCTICLDTVDFTSDTFLRACMNLVRISDDTATLRSIKKTLRLFRSLTLDQAVSIMRYFDGALVDDSSAVQVWLERLDLVPVSLFTLSEYFFARKKKQFFALWARVFPMFPIEFWVVFWSEQLWQALLYCSMKQGGDKNLTKKNYNRLPFSFTQRDWRAHDIHELARLHNSVYLCDYRVKNGQSDLGLDVLIYKFFEKTF